MSTPLEDLRLRIAIPERPSPSIRSCLSATLATDFHPSNCPKFDIFLINREKSVRMIVHVQPK